MSSFGVTGKADFTYDAKDEKITGIIQIVEYNVSEIMKNSSDEEFLEEIKKKANGMDSPS